MEEDWGDCFGEFEEEDIPQILGITADKFDDGEGAAWDEDFDLGGDGELTLGLDCVIDETNDLEEDLQLHSGEDSDLGELNLPEGGGEEGGDGSWDDAFDWPDDPGEGEVSELANLLAAAEQQEARADSGVSSHDDGGGPSSSSLQRSAPSLVKDGHSVLVPQIQIITYSKPSFLWSLSLHGCPMIGKGWERGVSYFRDHAHVEGWLNTVVAKHSLSSYQLQDGNVLGRHRRFRREIGDIESNLLHHLGEWVALYVEFCKAVHGYISCSSSATGSINTGRGTRPQQEPYNPRKLLVDEVSRFFMVFNNHVIVKDPTHRNRYVWEILDMFNISQDIWNDEDGNIKPQFAAIEDQIWSVVMWCTSTLHVRILEVTSQLHRGSLERSTGYQRLGEHFARLILKTFHARRINSRLQSICELVEVRGRCVPPSEEDLQYLSSHVQPGQASLMAECLCSIYLVSAGMSPLDGTTLSGEQGEEDEDEDTWLDDSLFVEYNSQREEKGLHGEETDDEFDIAWPDVDDGESEMVTDRSKVEEEARRGEEKKKDEKRGNDKKESHVEQEKGGEAGQQQQHLRDSRGSSGFNKHVLRIEHTNLQSRMSILFCLYPLIPVDDPVKAKVAFALGDYSRHSLRNSSLAEKLFLESLFVLDIAKSVCPQMISALGHNAMSQYADILLQHEKTSYAVLAFSACASILRLRQMHSQYFDLLSRTAAVAATHLDSKRAIAYYREILENYFLLNKKNEVQL